MARPDAPRRTTPWTVHNTETVTDCRVFKILARHSERQSDGFGYTFFNIDSSDWVNVVACTPEGQLVMVRQYRHGKRGDVLEVPGGMVDPGEDPETAAVRELREETGYAPKRVVHLGSANPNPALFTNRLHTYLAEGCMPVGAVQNDAAEETIVELVDPQELPQLIADGQVDHALVLTALYWWQTYPRPDAR